MRRGMNWSLAAFDEIPWATGAHPLEQKKVGPGGLALLQFEPGFSDPNWCPRSHVLFVVQGTLHLEFEGDTLELGPGQALWIEPGTPHRAAVRGGPAVVVFAASDFSCSP